MTGETAQKFNSRAIARHHLRDSRTWTIRTGVAITPGDAITQPTVTPTYTQFYPLLSVINEYEAENIGQNVLAGDLRLIADGALTINATTKLYCDGKEVDIIRVVPEYINGVVTQYKLYVRRAPE